MVDPGLVLMQRTAQGPDSLLHSPSLDMYLYQSSGLGRTWGDLRAVQAQCYQKAIYSFSAKCSPLLVASTGTRESQGPS